MQFTLKENITITDIIVAQLKRHAVLLGVFREQLAKSMSVIKQVDWQSERVLITLINEKLLIPKAIQSAPCRIVDAIMTSPRIIIKRVFSAIENRAIKGNKIVSRQTSQRQSFDVAVSRLAIARRTLRTIARSSSDRPPRSSENEFTVLVDNAMSYIRARPSTSNSRHSHRMPHTVRSKKLPRNAIKTRIDTTCPAAVFAHRERRHTDCKPRSIATGLAVEKENAA